MVKSNSTGKFYATARKSSITSTFDEMTCQALIGERIPGQIKKVKTEEYEFAIPETGEVIKLKHRWEYVPEEVSQPVMGGVQRNAFANNNALVVH